MEGPVTTSAPDVLKGEFGAEAPAALQRRQRWSLLTRVVFRFLSAYFVLYNLPVLLQVPHLGETWIAVHVFHLSGSVTVRHATGSGDTTLDYINLLFAVFLSAAITVLWSLIDRKRQHYRSVHGWIRLLVRYSLALTLFSYGLIKIFPLQMPFPSLMRLAQPFGNFSPMGVLWSFIGASPAYEMFSGIAECLGGMLLLFPQTTTLGALVSAGVTFNVVMLNFCYDVPVKLFSTNLFAMALFLAAPDLGKLANVLVLNRPGQPAGSFGPVFKTRNEKIGATAIKVLFVGTFLFTTITADYARYQPVHSPQPALYGSYEVENFTTNGKAPRWRRMVIERQGVSVQMTDDSEQDFGAEYPISGSSLTLFEIGNKNKRYRLACSKPDADHLVIQGNLMGDSVMVEMKKRDLSRFSLLNRGFHWIQEYPFNR